MLRQGRLGHLNIISFPRAAGKKVSPREPPKTTETAESPTLSAAFISSDPPVQICLVAWPAAFCLSTQHPR